MAMSVLGLPRCWGRSCATSHQIDRRVLPTTLIALADAVLSRLSTLTSAKTHCRFVKEVGRFSP